MGRPIPRASPQRPCFFLDVSMGDERRGLSHVSNPHVSRHTSRFALRAAAHRLRMRRQRPRGRSVRLPQHQQRKPPQTHFSHVRSPPPPLNLLTRPLTPPSAYGGCACVGAKQTRHRRPPLKPASLFCFLHPPPPPSLKTGICFHFQFKYAPSFRSRHLAIGSCVTQRRTLVVMVVVRADDAAAAAFAAGVAGQGRLLHCSDSRRLFDGAVYQCEHFNRNPASFSHHRIFRYSALASATLLLPANDDALRPDIFPATASAGIVVRSPAPSRWGVTCWQVQLSLLRLLSLSPGST